MTTLSFYVCGSEAIAIVKRICRPSKTTTYTQVDKRGCLVRVCMSERTYWRLSDECYCEQTYHGKKYALTVEGSHIEAEELWPW